MNSTKQAARIAGLLYLVNGATGFFGIIYVPSKLIISGNAAATSHNILASEGLFRLGCSSICIATDTLSAGFLAPGSSSSGCLYSSRVSCPAF
jgi:hypothetical protein